MTIGGLNVVKVFKTSGFEQVATIPVGDLPHGIWPSGDGSRVYVGIENGDAVTAIDTGTNRVIATIPNGQAAQALVYVPQAVPNDQEDFQKWAAALAAVGAEVTKFAEAKNYNEDAIIELTGKVSDACANCHDKYRNTPKEPEDRCMVSAPAAAK